VLVCVVTAALTVRSASRHPASSWADERARIMRELSGMAGRHLVIVYYGEEHSVHDEWIYNRADIDGSRVVWARGTDRDGERRLIEYFRDRRVWRLQPDWAPIRVEPLAPERP
jgi:hypothetical protein